VLAYARGERLVVLANFASRPAHIAPPDGAHLLVSTGLDRPAGAFDGALRANEGILVSRTV
jgi:hypothetical protein